MKISLKEGERLDDLQCMGYFIIQNKEKFCFGMDAVLLSAFAQVKEGEVLLDLGTGTGVIPLLLEAKTKGKSFVGLEIQEESADMAARSIAYNNCQDKIKILCGDIKEAVKIFGRASFDVVTSNPPYMNENHGLQNPSLPKAIARHEILCTLEDVIAQAAGLLRSGGRFYMIHRPRRFAEIMSLLCQYHLGPKRIRMVHPYLNKEANMVLIEAVRGGNPMVKVERPLILYQEPNRYTKEVLDLYGGSK